MASEKDRSEIRSRRASEDDIIWSNKTMNTITLILAATGVVSFKDASKIKSWDAWNDHEAKAAVTNVLQNERRCVTWAKLNSLDYGLRERNSFTAVPSGTRCATSIRFSTTTPTRSR